MPLIVQLLLLAVVTASAALAFFAARPRWRPRGGRLLRVAAFVAALITCLATVQLLTEDSAGATDVVVILGPPLLITAAPAALPGHRRWIAAVTWVCAALMLAYVVVYGLGVGLFFLPAALVLLAAAIAETRVTEAHEPPAAGGRTGGSTVAA